MFLLHASHSVRLSASLWLLLLLLLLLKRSRGESVVVDPVKCRSSMLSRRRLDNPFQEKGQQVAFTLAFKCESVFAFLVSFLKMSCCAAGILLFVSLRAGIGLV